MLAAMRDEQYAAQDLPSYGAHEQPALVSRTHGQLRKTLLGTVVAALGVASSVAGLVSYPDLDGVFQGRGWAQALVAVSAAMLVLCLWQHLSWRRAIAVWHGERNSDLAAVVAVSWILQLVSYAISVLALVVCAIALIEVGRFATTAVFLVLSLLAVLAAQILAGVQYVRAEGPPGTVQF
ncbi:hypothetical protein GCM10022204_42220 [Microlunatus aurantiacus]|uniref:DUF2975 domain-containing protein n=2 Tax=Microlunatus aurantiacus TaxID=446786 RepID=A0ABP7EDZ4_9ACTN